jgi:nitrogen regulatory protein PII
MKKIEAIVRAEAMNNVNERLRRIGVSGMTKDAHKLFTN